MMDKATALAELYDIVKNQSEAYYAHLASGGRADPEYEKSMAAIQFAYLYLRDPESLRPVGRWEAMHYEGGLFDGTNFDKCSACGYERVFDDPALKTVFKFCPNCGAKMEPPKENKKADILPTIRPVCVCPVCGRTDSMHRFRTGELEVHYSCSICGWEG